MALPDPIAVLRAWFVLDKANLTDATYADVRVGTKRPVKLTESPTIRLRRIGGGMADWSHDEARMLLELSYPQPDDSDDEQPARDFGNRVRSSVLYRLPGRQVSGALVPIYGVSEQSAPSWVPYDNTNVRRLDGLYTIRISAL